LDTNLIDLSQVNLSGTIPGLKGDLMHIMEGFLPWQWCLVWWIIALPCLLLGIYQLKRVLAADRDALPLLGVTGGFIFILSSLKLPSVTGSCSHPTGTGLSTISFGPWITAVVCAIVLLFQSLFRLEGVLRETLFLGGAWRDDCVYGLLAGEWRGLSMA
jgi:cobalt/nickel transport system permease protein